MQVISCFVEMTRWVYSIAPEPRNLSTLLHPEQRARFPPPHKISCDTTPELAR